MARRIIEQWRLAVLRVVLDVDRREPAVTTSLSAFVDGTSTTLWTRHDRPTAFGTEKLPPTDLKVPTALSDAVARSLVHDLHREAALWLRLVPPYGYLGAVPWEQALLQASRVPVFRVPDRMPMRAVVGQVWTAAVVVDAPPRSTWAPAYVSALIDLWRRYVPLRVEVDVFTDTATGATLRAERAHDPDVRIHDPHDAVAASQSREALPRGRSVPRAAPPGARRWADWISTGVKGRALRALHIVLDGALDDGDARLLLSPDPTAPVRRTLRVPVGVNDMLQFVDALGTATVSFGAPPRGDDVAIRMFADNIGQQRAGATLYSSLHLDPRGEELARTNAFLVQPDGDLGLPRHASLFGYVQPARIQAALKDHWIEPGPPVSSSDAMDEASLRQTDTTLAERYEGTMTVPSWVASSDQFLGKQWAELAKSVGSGIPQTPTRGAYDKGAAAGLNALRDIVERHAKP